MATAGYTSGNDYGVFNGRPVQLPVQAIANAFVAKNNAWEAGAARVKSRFDQSLDLDLSKPENIQLRDNYLKQAQEDLKTLNSEDLSDPSIQSAGINLFSNLFKDTGILSDDQATKHYKKIMSDAERARKNDNGKFYSDANVQYALDGWDEFLNSKDRTAGKDYLRKAKDYTPYYDFSAEANTVLKNCKPTEGASDSISGMYIKHVSSNALSASAITGCLDAGLSDKAKKQLSINGFVNYKQNPLALRDKYIPMISGESEKLSAQNANIQGLLANKDKLKKMSPDELRKMGIDDLSEVTPEYLEHLGQIKIANDLRLDNLYTTIAQLHNGDLTSMQGDNFEPIAGMVYAKDYMENFGRGFQYSQNNSSLKADPVQLMIYGQNRQDARQEDSQQFQTGLQSNQQDFQLKLEALKESSKVKTEKIKKGDFSSLTAQDFADASHFNSAFADDVAINSPYEKITKERQDIASQRADLNARFDTKFKRILPDNIKDTNTPEFKSWFSAYTKTLPANDPMWDDIHEYEDSMNKLIMQEDIKKNEQEEIDRVILKKHGELLDRSSLPKDVLKVNGTTITANDIQDTLEGKPSKIEVRKGKSYTIPSEYGSANVITPEEYYINGKKIPDTQLSQLQKLRQTTALANDNRLNNLKKERNDLASQSTIIQTEGFSFPQLNDKDSDFKKRIAQRLDVSEKDIDNISVGDLDMKGNAIITIKDDDKDPDFKKNTIEKLKSTYGVSDIKDLGNGSYKVGGFDRFNIIDASRTSNLFEPYIRAKESRVGINQPQNTGLIRSVSPHAQFGIEITPGFKTGTYSYRIYNNKNETIRTFNDRRTALQNFDLYLNAR